MKLIPDSLRNYGFTNIINVPEQDVTSGDFPTVASPNPEVPSAMAMAIAKAKEVDADLILASDPDADRIGCVLRDDNGEYVLINGNQIVMILLNYIMTRNKELGRITGNEYIVKTIVTTETIKSIADKNGFKMYDCYTGFKWIAAVIRENEGTGRYLGGGEGELRFPLPRDFCRDKDAVSAISLMAEALAWAKTKNMNFLQMLKDIYMTYGFSREAGISLVRKGKTGAEEIIAIMKNFRANPPKQLAGSPIVTIKDYADLNLHRRDYRQCIEDGYACYLQRAAVFHCRRYKGRCASPGTEPKIKFYVEVRGNVEKPEDYGKAIERPDAKIRLSRKISVSTDDITIAS